MANASQSRFMRLYDRVTEKLDRTVGWDKLPLPLGLAALVGIRDLLRQKNLYNTWRGETPRAATEGALAQGSPAVTDAPPPAPPPAPAARSAQAASAVQNVTVRTPDGTYNDLQKPLMGAAGTRFGRNVPLEYTHPVPSPATTEPDPRTVSRELLTRERFIPATTLNVIAAAWLQFMVRDWLSHGKSPKDRPWEVPVREDDPWPGARPMTILRIPSDPTRRPDEERDPPTYINAESHWWDASQLYGNDKQTQSMVRSGQDGTLRLDENGMIPAPMLTQLGEQPGWWLGLAQLFTLFGQEHNAICDRLRADYPTWSDDDLFERARLINAALLAKIHTVEWTPGIISHPTTQAAMRVNWWGLAGERLHNVYGRFGDSDLISGAPGSETDHHTADYSITEEFVAVYRMHPLTPDDYVLRSLAGAAPPQDHGFRDIAGPNVLGVLQQHGMANSLYSFGTAHPGAVVLHNFPRFLQEYERPDGILQDLAATDILRSRELGVPRYNQFRRLFHRNPVSSFEEITDNPAWAEEMRRVYNNDVERIDLSVGLFAEKRPQGFGFSETAFRVFALMAPRRLKSDRFFTTDYTPAVYTPAGMEWIDHNTMATVLLRHYPSLAPALRGVTNAFTPWTRLDA